MFAKKHLIGPISQKLTQFNLGGRRPGISPEIRRPPREACALDFLILLLFSFKRYWTGVRHAASVGGRWEGATVPEES